VASAHAPANLWQIEPDFPMRRLMMLLVLAVAPLSASAGGPPADLLDQADALEGEPSKVIELLAPHLDSGGVEVEARLANAYLLRAINETGHDSKEPGSDIQRAIELAKDAYARGDGFAANLLFIIYSHGFGGQEDLARAVEYLRRGDALGDEGARLNYGIALYNGDMPGVARDVARSTTLVTAKNERTRNGRLDDS